MDEKVITIEKVVFGGKGLSRDLQKVVFVPFTLPGEKVRVRIKKEHRDYLEAETIEVLEPSPTRVPPECRYFGRCGGCQISHAKYQTQVQMKKEMLEEALQRNHVVTPEIQVVATEPFGYRHRARLKWDNARKRLGFYEIKSHQVVEIRECLCLTPGLNHILKLLHNNLAILDIPGLSEIDCYENESGETIIFLNAPLPPSIPEKMQHETKVLDRSELENAPMKIHFRDYTFPMRPDIFLQVNPKLWNAMVLELESHHENSLQSTAVELYCGAGFFTLPLSRQFRKIIAVEENPSAIGFAKQNYSVKNIEWICEKAEHIRFPSEATVAILDPPRTGLHKKVLELLLHHPLQKISYVSCDSPSFARDARALSSRYEVKRLVLLDLFPQTFHFETIALFERISTG